MRLFGLERGGKLGDHLLGPRPLGLYLRPLGLYLRPLGGQAGGICAIILNQIVR
jgi:hypothetical protein